MIKFRQSIQEYKYILSFDLAKNVTGYSLIDFVNNKIIHVGVIDTTKDDCECLWVSYANKIQQAIIESLNCLPAEERQYVFITKEKLPNQSGKFSSIEALQALAQCHAICDTVVFNSGVAYYDFDGVHAVSVKAYFKSITGLQKPTKDDIRASLEKIFNYDLSLFALDVSDSIAVAVTLIKSKYNKDLAEQIKFLKKQLKTYKSTVKINNINAEIQKLLHLFIKDK